MSTFLVQRADCLQFSAFIPFLFGFEPCKLLHLNLPFHSIATYWDQAGFTILCIALLRHALLRHAMKFEMDSILRTQQLGTAQRGNATNCEPVCSIRLLYLQFTDTFFHLQAQPVHTTCTFLFNLYYKHTILCKSIAYKRYTQQYVVVSKDPKAT